MKCIVFLLPLVALACGRTTVGSGYGGDYQQWTGSNWMKNLETILGKYQGSEQTQYHDSSVGQQSQEKQRDTTYQSTKVTDSKDSSLLQQVVDSQTPKQQTQQSQYPTAQVVPFTNSWYQKYQQYFGQAPRQEDHFGQWFQQYAHGQYKPVANFWYQKEHQYQARPYQYNKFGDYQQYEGEAPSQQYWYQQYEYPVGQVSPVADYWYQKAQQYQVNPYQYNKYGDYQQYESQTPRQLEWFQKYMYPVGQVSPVADSWYQKAHQYQVNPYQYNKYGDYQQYQDVPYGSLEFGDDQKAMEEDETMGLIPFFVSTTLGTTSCCSFDNLTEIGQVCNKFPCVWLHVDAAYAGNAFICPELKHLLAGIEYADSFNTNPNKWLLTNFDCSTYWVRDRIRLTSALVVDPLYLQHGYSNATIDYRHWGVPLSRRFRSLKLWFVLRSYGISGLQQYIRNHIRLAKKFEEHVLKDSRFEICNEVKLALVCFRLKGTDKLNEKLLSNINASGKLHMVPSHVNDKYVIRFCVVSTNAEEADVDHAWNVIREFADELLESNINGKETELQDEVFELLERKKKETLAHKRSFFVRMVSDPKIYNPSIAKSMPSTRRHLTEQMDSPCSPDGNVTVQPPLSASWISWPLAFLFQGATEDGTTSDVPIRFRHLDTKVRLKASGKGNGSPSPDTDQSRSPKRSPASSRRSSPNNDTTQK